MFSTDQGDGLHQRRTWMESLGNCVGFIMEACESAENV